MIASKVNTATKNTALVELIHDFTQSILTEWDNYIRNVSACFIFMKNIGGNNGACKGRK